ncbi:MAG: TetR/AcrR family transcriptional regulator [Bradyrhizobiaceae bacterium]|nr:MAG: TetR/AcrR family transcriptional regulator [Bradyrhizobiaceae bacterium]
MRYSQDHKAQTRARIVSRAATSLRRHGSHGLGIAELMKQAGLTHGGFYAHFKSREALVAEATIFAMDGISEKWRKRAAAAPAGKRVDAIVNGYLTEQHRDDVGNGCVLPALGAEIARADARTRKAFAQRLEDMIALVVEAAGERPTAAARRRAMGTIGAMMGTLLLARATCARLSEDLLLAGRAAALGASGGAMRKPGSAKAARKASNKASNKASKKATNNAPRTARTAAPSRTRRPRKA